MNAAEIRELSGEELASRLEGMKEELFNLRFQMATGQLDNPMRIKQVRHDIARVLTTLRARELEGLAEADDAAAGMVVAPSPADDEGSEEGEQ